ncbi:centrosomal protein 43-like isoform X2 [Haliotis rufescens]|uniref:centrosomal protein 43-like isoform X2 n=1 Tax=Haliotis rufescens TaxID=6454 RepID=UPI00201E752E|nr:centrosomal protein 43-like isoform X2 [Haliotis rufescens]
MRSALFPNFKMSADEDTELRDLVAQTLETNGTLGKIRAQLRASVFLALEEQESVQNKTPFLNKDLKQFLSTKEGRQIASLVREFLEFFDLEFTLAVFDPETGLGQDYDKRATLARELKLPDTGSSPKAPLLSEVVRPTPQGSKPPLTHSRSITEEAEDTVRIPKELTATQIEAAQKKFEYYDKDGSGSIDKDELRDLFIDIFPHFHKNMLDRYVNDEFKAVDSDFSSRIYSLTPRGIDFEEFLGMYKRLFLLCRTVVSDDVGDIVPTSPKKMRDVPSSPPSSKSSSYAENNFFNSLEAKNHKNLEHNKQPSSEASNGPKHNSLIDLGSDQEGDSFFDEPVPAAGSYTLSNRNVSPSSHNRRSSSPGRTSQIPVYIAGARSEEKDKKPTSNGGTAQKHGTGNMSSLQGLPSLTSDKAPPAQSHGNSSLNASSDPNLRSLDKRMVDLGFGDSQEDFEYEDDFQDSIHSASAKSPRVKSEAKSVNENGGGSIAEEIEEEDLDDFSIEGEDFLKSDKSEFDDMTTDRSISQADGGFDYAEEVHLP